MRTSKKGLNIIKEYEKLGPEYARSKRIVAYLCPENKVTIGYGHTKNLTRLDVGVKEISLEQAESLLKGDVHDAEAYVDSKKLTLNQNQYDALVSLVFNCGSIGDTLLAKLKAGDTKGIVATMKRYIHGTGPKSVPCGGKCGLKACKLRRYDGLVRRRAQEVELFLSNEGLKDAP